MVIRARSSIALHCASDADCRLYGPLGPSTTPTGASQVAPLGPIDLDCSTVQEGTFLLQPIAFLAADAMPRVYACPRSATTLPALFVELQAGEAVYGALLPWGAFNLATLLPQRYVQQHMLYDAAARKRLASYESASQSDLDTITALFQECDDTGLGKSTILDEEHMASRMSDVLLDQAREFDRHFFALQATNFCGYQRPAYKLPSTFYMTTYRAQVSESSI